MLKAWGLDLGRHPRWIYAGINGLLLALAVVAAYSGDPRLTSSSRGIVVALLVLLYCGWSFVGWVRFFPLRERALRVRLSCWFGMLATCLALVALNHEFIILLWILFGGSVFYLGMPLGIAGMIGVVAVIGLIQTGGFRVPLGRGQGGFLAGWLLVAIIWFVLVVTLERLMRQRTKNEELIAELRASQEQLRQAAAQERELVVLRERARLARDLHDIIGHALVLASVKLEAAQRLQRVDHERAASELAATQQLLRQTMTELRQAVSDLRTVPSDRQELAATIAGQVREIVTQTGLRAEVHCDPVGELSPSQEEALLRVAQEALTNIVRHGGATAIAVALRAEEHGIALEIGDDGRGFDVDTAAAGGHFGLRGMRERMELVGGTLAVNSAPGAGTRVRAAIPLAAVARSEPNGTEEVVRGAA